jgi:hypothetical protein
MIQLDKLIVDILLSPFKNKSIYYLLLYKLIYYLKVNTYHYYEFLIIYLYSFFKIK